MMKTEPTLLSGLQGTLVWMKAAGIGVEGYATRRALKFHMNVGPPCACCAISALTPPECWKLCHRFVGEQLIARVGAKLFNHPILEPEP